VTICGKQKYFVDGKNIYPTYHRKILKIKKIHNNVKKSIQNSSQFIGTASKEQVL
jgi:trehalose utilization protein